MKALSCFSINPDPYKAGVEIAESVASISPEVLFIFPTIHYDGSPEMAEAIYEVLQNDDMILIGNTGEGFYEKNKVSNSGVSALAINSSGKIKYCFSKFKGVGSDPLKASIECTKKINDECDFSKPVLYYMTSDFRTDAELITKGLAQTIKEPLIGGLAGDDNSFSKSWVYLQREVLEDTLVVLALNGDFNFEIRTAHELQPIGSIGRVTRVEGTKILSISDIPAMNFLEREMGKKINYADQGIITFKVMESLQSHGHKIRSVLLPEDSTEDSSLKLFSAVDEGQYVQVCLAPPEMMLRDIEDIGESIKDLTFNPTAALIVSCAGRKKVLANEIEYEVKTVVSKCPTISGLAGYPSFGEFGSVKNQMGYTRPLFHNMTFILLLLGDKDS